MPDWTQEETAILLAMRGRGESLSAIGCAVGKKRSAVAGRVYRLALPLICPANAHMGPRGGKYRT
jgi:hypothetical protein